MAVMYVCRICTTTAAGDCLHSAANGTACPGSSSTTFGTTGVSVRCRDGPAELRPTSACCTRTASRGCLRTAAATSPGPAGRPTDRRVWPATRAAGNSDVRPAAADSGIRGCAGCPGSDCYCIRTASAGTDAGLRSAPGTTGGDLTAASTTADSCLHGAGWCSSSAISVQHPTTSPAAASSSISTSHWWPASESGRASTL